MQEILVLRHRAIYDLFATQVGGHSIGPKSVRTEFTANTGELLQLPIDLHTILPLCPRGAPSVPSCDQRRALCAIPHQSGLGAIS